MVASMNFPNFKEKYDADSLITPETQKDFDGPESVILCYDPKFYKYITENYECEKVESSITLYLLKDNKEIGFIGDFGIGAPAAVVTMELLIANGVKRFLSIGTAGSLQREVRFGDVVVCQKAIRDEGTSYHYIPPSKFAYPSEKLTAKAEKVLKAREEEYYKGVSWTIDAPYRETIPEVRKYRDEGVITVEMEAAALFALGEYRNVDVACIFTISDHLNLDEQEWESYFDETHEHLKKLFKIARKILTQ